MTAILAVMALTATVCLADDPAVSNVRAEQRVGTKLVDIWYDVTGEPTEAISVSLNLSNGETAIHAASFSGDVGIDIYPGTDKHIVWDAGADWTGNLSENVRANIVADLPIPPGMVMIPGGTNSGNDPDFGAYSLTVSTFYMDKYEVTKAKWKEVYVWALANGYGFDNAGSGKADNHPVRSVNWYDCAKWCNALSEKEGRTPCYNLMTWACNSAANGYRLPTVNEWEYAARGGLSGKRFPWGDTIQHTRANYYSYYGEYPYDNSATRGFHPTYNDGKMPYTSPAGSFDANGYGLYDMVGNVWEWCNDASIRGGAWDYTGASFARCGDSGYKKAKENSEGSGFRAVRKANINTAGVWSDFLTIDTRGVLTVHGGTGSGVYTNGSDVSMGV